MFMILDFIWTKVKHDLKKRLLLLDEAWTLMQYPDSAAFVYSLAKRARKYYLGLTTITQDVNDFLNTDYGKAVVTNSSIQILLKQHPAAIDKISEIFYLSQGERNFLLAAGIGEGLFFAGTNHVAMQVKASPQEHELVTTNPKEVKARQDQDKQNAIPMNNIPQRTDQDFERLRQRYQNVNVDQGLNQNVGNQMPQQQPQSASQMPPVQQAATQAQPAQQSVQQQVPNTQIFQQTLQPGGQTQPQPQATGQPPMPNPFAAPIQVPPEPIQPPSTSASTGTILLNNGPVNPTPPGF
jgi:hypothetical protein